jgi:hypothetical protein
MDQIYDWIASYWTYEDDASANATTDIHVVEDPTVSPSTSTSKLSKELPFYYDDGPCASSSTSRSKLSKELPFHYGDGPSSSSSRSRSTLSKELPFHYGDGPSSSSSRTRSKMSKELPFHYGDGPSASSSRSRSTLSKELPFHHGNSSSSSIGESTSKRVRELRNDWTWVEAIANPIRSGSSIIIQSQRDITDGQEAAEAHQTEWESPDFALEWDDHEKLLEHALHRDVMVLRNKKKKRSTISRADKSRRRHELSRRVARHTCIKKYERSSRKSKLRRHSLRQPSTRRT